MKIDLKFVQLHESLFLNGINFGLKLYPDSKGGLVMYYDTDLEKTIIIHKENAAMLQNVASMTLATPSQIGLTMKEPVKVVVTSPPVQTHPPVKVQVSGPEKPVMRSVQVEDPTMKIQGKPGAKKPKFQGEESQGE